MCPFRTVEPGSDGSNAASPPRSASTLFTILWEALAASLGTAAVAAIVRRAALRAAPSAPELRELVVRRDGLEYSYTMPPSWSREHTAAPPALRELVVEIGRVLVDLTGTVVIRQLERIPELRASGLVWPIEEAN